jgi:hypothetical protein
MIIGFMSRYENEIFEKWKFNIILLDLNSNNYNYNNNNGSSSNNNNNKSINFSNDDSDRTTTNIDVNNNNLAYKSAYSQVTSIMKSIIEVSAVTLEVL